MKKIISSILAASFIFATCAMNVMAAPTSRTLSVKATPATELKAGDTVTVEVVLDKTLDLFSADYTLSFDPAVFSIDTVKESRLEKYIDSDWYSTSGDGIRNPDGDFAFYLGNPTYGQGSGYITFAWGGSTPAGTGVEASYAKTDRVIGKFYLTVASVPASGSSELTITGHTGGYKENTGDTVTTVPATVKFASAEPTVTPWEVAITAEPKYENGYIWKADTTKGDGNLTKFDVTFTDADSNTLTRSILSSDKSGTFDWNAATTFYVGLKTARTVTAAWDIAAKDGEKDVPVELK